MAAVSANSILPQQVPSAGVVQAPAAPCNCGQGMQNAYSPCPGCTTPAAIPWWVWVAGAGMLWLLIDSDRGAHSRSRAREIDIE